MDMLKISTMLRICLHLLQKHHHQLQHHHHHRQLLQFQLRLMFQLQLIHITTTIIAIIIIRIHRLLFIQVSNVQSIIHFLRVQILTINIFWIIEHTYVSTLKVLPTIIAIIVRINRLLHIQLNNVHPIQIRGVQILTGLLNIHMYLHVVTLRYCC